MSRLLLFLCHLAWGLASVVVLAWLWIGCWLEMGMDRWEAALLRWERER